MALGYCMTCAKLVSIRLKARNDPSRNTEWVPVHHDAPDGKPCDGHKRVIR